MKIGYWKTFQWNGRTLKYWYDPNSLVSEDQLRQRTIRHYQIRGMKVPK